RPSAEPNVAIDTAARALLSPSYSHAAGGGRQGGSMKRFWMLLGVAVVAGAMYVAAAPGSRQATGPTARQFAALKKQVALLNKKLTAPTNDEKVVKTTARAAVGFIRACCIDTSRKTQNLPVTQFGATTAG